MIQIIQARQVEKARYLADMHRFRTRVFRDRMGWQVQVTSDGLEVDQFDLPEAVYILACDHEDRVVGNLRLLPAMGPTMIRDVWPQFLETIDMPATDPRVWETSRFGVNMPESAPLNESLARSSRITAEMIIALNEICIHCGIRQIFSMYDMRIERILNRLDCLPERVSGRTRIDKHMSQVGCFHMDRRMLARMQHATGIRDALVRTQDLPPSLLALHFKHMESQKREEYCTLAYA